MSATVDLVWAGAGSTATAPATAGMSLLVVGRRSAADEPLRRSLRNALAMAEFAETVADAERLLPRCHFDCIVVEAGSAMDPALAWIEELRRDGFARSVCVAAASEASVASASLRAGASAVLALPLDAKSLQRFLATQATPAAGKAANAAARIGSVNAPRVQLVGQSAPIRHLRDIVERVAPTPATVLIEGQTGTGKELVARLLHERSGRRGAFVPVNCGAIPPELMETELFGHAKGAFTGAHQQREGLFLAAKGGTLFLDEISEMRSDLQVKLLRALEESRIRPVGSDREVPIDVRIVASAQPGLREQVQQRRFRQDLFYRLNVVHVMLPGLRERPEDIRVLFEHFMQRAADEFSMAPVALDDAQFAQLRAREWPGNVRELRNFVERTVLMGGPPADESTEPAAATGTAESAAGAYPLDWTLEQVKQAHILRVLVLNDGNRSATARQLGVSRKTLERRLGPGGVHDGDDE
ncbi:MAG TPA: sigma-54 dependent transcriptional regulator [Steroidobacteraceae bacterium]|nr:sigma-54 dependent transcriptional regulator [Steroidobacteraceae bacterium]